MDGNIGFIGLGAMGYGMASNTRRKMSKTQVLYIFDVNPSVCQRFKDELQKSGDVQIASSAKEVAERSVGVISILPSAAIVEKTFLDGITGVVAARKNGQRILIECSTIDNPSAQRIGQEIMGAGSGIYVDSPVSGGAPAAAAGTLSYILGHPEPNPATDKRLLQMVSWMANPEKIFWCGGLGKGTLVKIVNNYLSGTILLANCEAMATGIKSGIDPGLLYRVISNSTGQSFMFSNVNPVPGLSPNKAPSNHDYQGGFREPMMIKDMNLAIDAASAAGIEPSLAKAARAVYQEASKDLYVAERDATAVYQWLIRNDIRF
ncbi:hypothetical protein ACJZ2D_016016 [Fusarium nematophilum]